MARGGGGGRGRGRGRGGGGGGGKASEPRDVMVSKKLSWLLRHAAEKQGLEIGRGGYINLESVVYDFLFNVRVVLEHLSEKIIKLREANADQIFLYQLKTQSIKSLQPPPTLAEIREIVATNSKQRFSLIHISTAPSDAIASNSKDDETTTNAALPDNDDDNPSHYLIRANQGHSLKLTSGTEDLMNPITVEVGNLPSLAVHGSRRDNWAAIVATGGLKPMGRNHVHFATGVPASVVSSFALSKDDYAEVSKEEDVAASSKTKPEEEVVSGMRNTSSIVMFLDLRKALDAGLKFWMSDNGVVLSEGNKDGIVPLDLFEKVVEKGGKVLLDRGVLASDRSEKGGKGLRFNDAT